MSHDNKVLVLSASTVEQICDQLPVDSIASTVPISLASYNIIEQVDHSLMRSAKRSTSQPSMTIAIRTYPFKPLRGFRQIAMRQTFL